MKKILEMFGEPITYGGQESVVYNMLSTFDLKNKYNVDLFTPYFANNKNLIHLVIENEGSVYSLNNIFKTNDNRLLLSKDVNSFFDTNSNYDVVHIHTGSLTTMYVYAKAAKTHGIKKVIVHAHSATTKKNIFYKLFKTLLCILMQKYVDVFLGCSIEAINSKFAKNIQKVSKIVYNGIDVDKFKFNDKYREDIRKEYNIFNKFVIGSLGRLDKEKNIYLMLNIVKKMSNYEDIVLMIVGDGPLKNELLNRCKDFGIEEKVIFTGNKIETNKFYCSFDCFLLTSFYEGLGITSIEAQCSGLPTLISNSITKEGMISSNSFYLDINNIDLWINKIIEIKSSQNEKYNRITCKIDFDKFDRNKTFKIVEKVYNE